MPVGTSYGVSYQNVSQPLQRFQNGGPVTSQSINYSPNIIGYSRPYASHYSKGGSEPMISPTIPQCQLSYGKILPSPVPVGQKVFKMPLLSSIIGVLIPADQFLLIPLLTLNNLLI